MQDDCLALPFEPPPDAPSEPPAGSMPKKHRLKPPRRSAPKRISQDAEQSASAATSAQPAAAAESAVNDAADGAAVQRAPKRAVKAKATPDAAAAASEMGAGYIGRAADPVLLGSADEEPAEQTARVQSKADGHEDAHAVGVPFDIAESTQKAGMPPGQARRLNPSIRSATTSAQVADGQRPMGMSHSHRSNELHGIALCAHLERGMRGAGAAHQRPQSA